MSVYDDAGSQWDIDPNLLRAVEMQESGGQTAATSPAGAQGNMQFMPPTARGVGVANTRDPNFSVPGTAKLLHDLLQGPAQGDITTALRMYHGGPDPSKWGPVNAAYAPAVMSNLQKVSAQQPPTTAQLGFNPARMSDAELTARLNQDVAAASSPKAAAPASSASQGPAIGGMTDAQLQAQLDSDVAASKAPAPGAPSPATQPQPGESTTHAVLRGLATPGSPTYAGISDEPAFLAGQQQAVRNIGITGNRLIGDPLNMLPGETAARDAFNTQYANNGSAQFGNMVGSAAATLPIMGVVNPLVSRAVGAGVNALSSAAPKIASAAQGSADFLSGTFGAPTAAGAGSVPLQVLSRGALGAAQGGEAAAINSGQSDNPLASQVIQGAATGAGVGAALPALGAAGNALTGRSAQISPEVAQIAQMARDKYGIQLTAPQLGLSPSLAYANSALKMVPLSGAGAENAATQQQFNRAVSQTFGEDATKITPGVLTAAQKRIGGVLNTVENGANVSLDQTFLHDAARIETNARTSLPDSEFGVIKRQFDNIMTNLQPGDTITGTTYGNLIHKGSPLDSALNSSDSNIKNFAGQIRDALRDSLTRSLSPEDASAYQEARTQYKNLMTVRPLTLRADSPGSAMQSMPSTGDISPASLRSAVNRSYGDNVAMEAPGSVPLNDLARIGQMLKEPPSSGTAERGSMMALGAKAAQFGGALAAGNYTGVLPAVGGLAATIAGGRLAGSYLRSPALANRMIDTSLNPLLYQAPNPLMLRYAAPLAALANPLATTAPQQRR